MHQVERCDRDRTIARLCRRIVDLVSTGSTLRANGLVEVEEIANITSRLAVNRTAMKTRPTELTGWIERFREAVHDLRADTGPRTLKIG